MSGPKSYEYPAPPPDMSATYDFNLSSAEEAAGVMAQLSAVGSGVGVSISGGRISVYVSDSGYRAGLTASVIRSRVNAAREAYQHQLLIKRVRAAENEVSRLKTSIEDAARNKQAALNDAAAQCTALFAELNVNVVTPFGNYSMVNEQNEVRRRGIQFKTEANGVDAEKRQCLNRCDEYLRRVKSASSVGEVSSISKPPMRIAETAGKIEAATLSREMREKKSKLNGFTSFLTELDKILKNKGLEEFRSRVTDKVRSVSAYSSTAVAQIKALVEQVEKEKKYSLESEKLDRAETEAANAIRAQLGALAEIKKLLVPLEADTQNAAGVSLDYAELCAAAAADCDGVASEIEGRSFLSHTNRTAYEKLRGTLSVYSKTAASRELYDAIKALKAKLDELNKSVAAESEKYDKFAEQVRTYTDLFYRFNHGNQAFEKVLAALDDPEELLFEVSDADAQIQRLSELNAELKGEIEKYEREVTCAAMLERLSASKFGKVFKTERLEDGSVHITYVRTDSKGVMYDVICKEGKMLIYPRGVVLGNGKATLSAAELKKFHGSCHWAEEINEAFAEIGITGNHSELGQEECEATYDLKNYYHIRSRNESIRFLRLCGYTQKEIEAFGYGTASDGRGEGAEAQTGAGQAIAREIKK